MQLDRDLASIQEVRDLIRAAKKAQALLAEMNQRQVDDIVRAMSEAACRHARELAHMAVEETGFGVEGDKVTKNLFAGRTVYESIRDVRSIGIIGEDREKRILEAAVPVGVVAGLVPSTNPTSTTIFKALISVKAGNALIVSPHPSAVRCIGRTVEILTEAAGRMGAPAGMLSMMTLPTLQGTSELMKLSDLILATGGTAMVKAAYSSGTPALGVGPGNVPAYIERTANIPDAVRRILASKTFDNGTICASEQSIVTERCVKNEVIAELKRQGGHFVSGEDADRLARVILRPGAATVNPRIVGRSPQTIADMAGIRIPEGTRVLLSRQTEVSRTNPYSREKLCPVLAFYVAEDWEEACALSISILQNEGCGHTMTIHSTNQQIIREFALKKPVSRLLVNTPGALGGVGATTGLAPALTLGCGAVGGSATSDNIGPENLVNIRRVAWGLRELEDLRQGAPAPAPSPAQQAGPLSPQDIEAITRAVIAKLTASNA